MLTAAFFHIAQHPNVLQNLRLELDPLMPNQITGHKLAELPYLNAVIKETLRFCPPALLLLPRWAMDDVEIGGCIIPKHTSVIVPNWSIFRDARYFTQPDAFIPERWLDPTFRLEQTFGKSAHLPFSTGIHSCIGQTYGLAQLEMRLTLAYWVSAFDAVLVDPNSSFEFEEHFVLSKAHCRIRAYPRDMTYV
ncbi:Cytochrome P450 3A4 [Neolecta irregularis DAH-3]|uniref:Cytochrome P450 3A4 n=1 Tax=Neolecta irregularis (strain DAH-3) TaxID=1198029 RepID=A0A1U7LK79_NEOID|nr:Cytochrome P450 3A4 [Neolecta irregularis DAH-3]|eukprot:OLL23065.1 Cytochrome P450 3A4 [Neolecta irregularis DAH-3]